MAKIGTLVSVMLLVSFAFLVMGNFAQDLQDNYIDTGISSAIKDNSTLRSNFTIAQDLNDSFGNVITGIQEAQSGEVSSPVGDLFRGGVIMFQAVISLPSAILSVLASTITLITLTATDILKIPQEILLIGMVAITLWLVFKLVAYGRRFEA
tara:strand:- start:2285 stop:2740 length:456 start_codon:yes stop_codon:yes gene_type:complete